MMQPSKHFPLAGFLPLCYAKLTGHQLFALPSKLSYASCQHSPPSPVNKATIKMYNCYFSYCVVKMNSFALGECQRTRKNVMDDILNLRLDLNGIHIGGDKKGNNSTLVIFV